MATDYPNNLVSMRVEALEKTCWKCGETFFTTDNVCPNDGAKLLQIALGEEHDPLLGQLLDERFKIQSKLGEGGMGTVYRARQLKPKRDVAIKVLKADYLRDENIRRRFMHEARIISELDHPNAVALYDFGQTPDGNFFMVMELLRGESLAERLAYKFLTYREVFDLIIPMCNVLFEVHRQGVVHRDLKPENIFITTHRNGREVAKLLDFGVAKQLEHTNMTRTGTMWGTPAYMSPEQAHGDTVAAAADIYAIGIIIYELVCGHLPFHATTQMGYAVKHMHAQARAMKSAPGLTSVPDEFEALVMSMLSKDPELRPKSMDVVVKKLKRLRKNHFGEVLLDSVPAQEVDPELLKGWMKEGELEGEELTHAAAALRSMQELGQDSIVVLHDEPEGFFDPKVQEHSEEQGEGECEESVALPSDGHSSTDAVSSRPSRFFLVFAMLLLLSLSTLAMQQEFYPNFDPKRIDLTSVEALLHDGAVGLGLTQPRSTSGVVDSLSHSVLPRPLSKTALGFAMRAGADVGEAIVLDVRKGAKDFLEKVPVQTIEKKKTSTTTSKMEKVLEKSSVFKKSSKKKRSKKKSSKKKRSKKKRSKKKRSKKKRSKKKRSKKKSSKKSSKRRLKRRVNKALKRTL